MNNVEKATHTPGPWDWTDGDGDEKWVFAPSDDRFGYLAVQGEANARLIAAAPELLEALKALLSQRNNIEVLGEWSAEDRNHASQKQLSVEIDAVVKDARAAIAKATGVQP